MADTSWGGDTSLLTSAAGAAGGLGSLASIPSFMSIGGAIGSLFGRNGASDEMTHGYQISMDEFKKYIDEALKSVGQHETQGRSDLEKYLGISQGYGAPYREAGESALQAYLGSMGLGGQAGRQTAMQSFQTSPSYQFALNQGLQQGRKQAAASGQRGSGAEQKALTRYATDLANQEYNQWQKGLSGLADMGQQSSEQAAQRAFNTGGSLSSLGLGYSGQTSGLYSTLAQAMAELQAQKAAAAAAGKSSGGLLGGLF